jgi:LPS-assembly lipoprotein
MRAVFTLALALLLAACGFQLRGTAQLPFDTLYMPPATTPGIALDLKRNIQSGTNTKVIDDPQKAEAVLEFLLEFREKHILSLAATGRVREYQLRYRVTFRVHDGKGGEFLPASTVQLTRDISFNDSEVLAKESEEQLLYRDMQFDMVQQIMRRLAGAQRPKPAAL